MNQKISIDLKDVLVVIVSAACIATALEYARPGLMSSIVDISTLWVAACFVLCAGVLSGSFAGGCNRWQSWYVLFAASFATVILGVSFSLQYHEHLLALLVVAVACVIALYELTLFYYDQRRHHKTTHRS